MPTRAITRGRMPENAVRVTLPSTEVCMYLNIAGQQHWAAKVGEDAGVGHEAEGRPVRGPLIVVLQVLAGHVRGVGIAQPLEDFPELVFAEKEEEEHRVRLLGELVTVRVVTGRLQDPVQPLDVAVLSAISLPVQFLQVFVTLELADDPVAVERDEHPTAHVPPHRQLVVVDAQPLAQLLRSA